MHILYFQCTKKQKTVSVRYFCIFSKHKSSIWTQLHYHQVPMKKVFHSYLRSNWFAISTDSINVSYLLLPIALPLSCYCLLQFRRLSLKWYVFKRIYSPNIESYNRQHLHHSGGITVSIPAYAQIIVCRTWIVDCSSVRGGNSTSDQRRILNAFNFRHPFDHDDQERHHSNVSQEKRRFVFPYDNSFLPILRLREIVFRYPSFFAHLAYRTPFSPIGAYIL